MKKSIIWMLCVMTTCAVFAGEGQQQSVVIVTAGRQVPRIGYGIEQLVAVLTRAGYTVTISTAATIPAGKKTIIVGYAGETFIKKTATAYKILIDSTGKEGFSIHTARNVILIAGADASGVLYGCMELVENVKAQRQLPVNLSVKQQPEMVLRGACIGVQKPYYLPGRTVYEYPYTPETFPWLYDKALWIKYLDSLVANRMNSLYLWNGHPFASLVKLKEYPYAVEVDEATFKKNEELFRFLATEADKRGIWLIQMFYNIIVSKPFAEKHGIKTQDRNRPIVPLIADYTRKSIAAFVAKYPNVGLLITLGEAMEGAGQDDVDWFTKTIIPGVQDGLKIIGKKEEPPIVLRAHDSDAPRVMKSALPLYRNLYTMAKYNGEALTTYTPRGPWAELHRSLSRIGTVQIENVHIMANLEPFRYGSPDFIQKCVQAMHNVYEANGLHIYPQASYWDWPYSADNTPARLLQVERDWIWYKAWARYAWNCHRDRPQEIAYWSNTLAAKYGCTDAQAKNILEAYEQAGEIAPKLLRRYGITDGNRQTLTLGMLMTQLMNPKRYGLFTLLYNSEGPEGEMIIEYAEKEYKQQPHVGETPPQVAAEVVEHGRKAVEAIEQAASFIKKDKGEFERLKNDMYCYKALADYYAAKASAAVQVLKYKYSNNVADLEPAVPLLQKSVAAFQKLAELTKNAYLYANSMQTQQRKIPVGGNDAKNKTWIELLPFYERELQNFQRHLDSLKAPKPVTGKPVAVKPLENAHVQWLNNADKAYLLHKGAALFADTGIVIHDLAAALAGLKGLRLSAQQQRREGTLLKFTTTAPVKLLIGYFNVKDTSYLLPPQLETDASANDYGQAEPVISNALLLEGFPSVNVHAYFFKPGEHTLTLGKGRCLVLGVVPASIQMPVYDAGLQDVSVRQLDWLFE
jgi:hypothetical protein